MFVRKSEVLIIFLTTLAAVMGTTVAYAASPSVRLLLLDNSVGKWLPIAQAPLSPRAASIAHWTGSEMIIWGGESADGSEGNGALYNLGSDSWTMMSNSSGPSYRTDMFNFRESWTGRYLFIWGGRSAEGAYYGTPSPASYIRWDGAIYDIIMESWTPMSAHNAPRGRAYLHGIWTGTEMLVFGGDNGQEDGTGQIVLSKNDSATGHIFNPGSDWSSSLDDSWRPMSTVNGLSQRKHAVVVWTGSKMIVWGGTFENTDFYNDGFIYDPITDSWSALSNIDAPEPRRLAAYVWTGTELIIWSGWQGETRYSGNGAVLQLHPGLYQ